MRHKKHSTCLFMKKVVTQHLKRTIIVSILFAGLVLCGCSDLLNSYFEDTLPQMEGSKIVRGIRQPVSVRRDAMGIPFIEAGNMDDLAFAIGYVNASDRLSQMIGIKLLSQGRLSEMIGRVALDIDIYIRSHNINKLARILYSASSDKMKNVFRCYSAGVNAYVEEHQDNLPPDLQLLGYTPDKWEPIDSASILSFLCFGLAFNLREEINSLNIAQAIGTEKMPWLLPIYPDEPLPFEEGQKLAGINLKNTMEDLTKLTSVQKTVADIAILGVAASNNWAISRERSAKGACILANDTHLPLSMPSIWHMMHIRCPEYDAAGIAVAGIPAIIAGYNGHIAWGMTMVMADNQDIYLEKLKLSDGNLHYLYKGQWQPTTQRKETFQIKGEEPVSLIIHETIHGPLLNDALKGLRKHELMSMPVDLPYGIAVSWAVFEADKTLDAFFLLGQAHSVAEAAPVIKQIRAISLNMVFADHDNIAWQVTGRFPIRKKGRGFMPSPGWTGEYDWDGCLDVNMHPNSINPPEGFLCSANNRIVPPDSPVILSSSWHYPERAERIVQLVKATKCHTLKTSARMQFDSYSLYVPKLKNILLDGDLYQAIKIEIGSWADEEHKEKALEAITMLQQFDGNMAADSPDASIVGALLHAYTYNTFFDELGPEDSLSWLSFLDNSKVSYSAHMDHIILRDDESPFWDDIQTPEKETKSQIIARSLADAITLLEDQLGQDRADWQWGKLHTYHWATEASKLAKHMGIIERIGIKLLSFYFNRGPFPADGDYTTLNVAGYHIAKDFDVWLIPEMRIIIDFGLKEPFFAMNSSGQSGNPASPHYDDGIYAWLNRNYQALPFEQENIRKQYNKVLVLHPADN